jgi:hypothetical protein
MNRIKKFFTPSKTSRLGGRKACLCEDNTYSINCCDGSLRGQGIGKTQSNCCAFSSGFSNGFLN